MIKIMRHLSHQRNVIIHTSVRSKDTLIETSACIMGA